MLIFNVNSVLKTPSSFPTSSTSITYLCPFFHDQSIIMGFGLHCLWLFPFIAGTTWLMLLFALLGTWIIHGCLRYPGQSNPYIPYVFSSHLYVLLFHELQLLTRPRYISDIGAFSARPIFLIGSTIVAISFVLTIYSIHYSRYAPKMYHFGHQDSSVTKTASWAAVLSSIVAGVSLVTLTVLDTYRFPLAHIVVMTWCFLSLDITSYCLTYVWWDEMSHETPFKTLQKQ